MTKSSKRGKILSKTWRSICQVIGHSPDHLPAPHQKERMYLSTTPKKLEINIHAQRPASNDYPSMYPAHKHEATRYANSKINIKIPSPKGYKQHN